MHGSAESKTAKPTEQLLGSMGQNDQTQGNAKHSQGNIVSCCKNFVQHFHHLKKIEEYWLE